MGHGASDSGHRGDAGDDLLSRNVGQDLGHWRVARRGAYVVARPDHVVTPQFTHPCPQRVASGRKELLREDWQAFHHLGWSHGCHFFHSLNLAGNCFTIPAASASARVMISLKISSND